MPDKKKILVIDDEQFSLKTVQACMRGTDYSLTLCLDPQEAYSKFKSESYDVIITDINMNGINGFDLRGLIAAVKLIRNGLTAGQALEMGIVNKSTDDFERQIVADIVAVRISASLGAADVFEEK